jgi:TatD DNase family protein
MNHPRPEDDPLAEPTASSSAARPGTLFDTHAHLELPEFAASRAEVVARAVEAGVGSILCVGIDVDSSEASLQCAEEFNLVAAVGIHPNSASEAGGDDWNRIVAMLDHPHVVALGETGLDCYWDHAPLALQQDYFDRHLRLAQEQRLPVVIHCRDAQTAMMPMLRAAAGRGLLRGVMHAFSGDEEMADECVALGLHISFAGNVTYTNKKFDVLRAVAKTLPADRLLVETDSPFLIPQVFRGKQKVNEPANVVHTARFLAELRGVPLDELAAATTTNARQLFRLP